MNKEKAEKGMANGHSGGMDGVLERSQSHAKGVDWSKFRSKRAAEAACCAVGASAGFHDDKWNSVETWRGWTFVAAEESVATGLYEPLGHSFDPVTTVRGTIYSCAAYAMQIDKDPAEVEELLRKLLASGYGSAEMMALLSLNPELECCAKKELPEELQVPPMILEQFICDEEGENPWTSTQAYIARSEDQTTVVMACMGTEKTSANDWVTNSRGAWSLWRPFREDQNLACCGRTAKCAALVMLQCCTDLLQCGPQHSELPYVHMGFYDAFKPLRVYIDEHLVPLAMCKETREIVITGHSMGGALANLCLVYFLMKIDIAALVAEKKTLCFCTIGTPRVGNRAFCDLMVTMLAPLKEAGLLQFNRIVCNLDPICTIPLYLEGFCHVSPPEVFIKIPGVKHSGEEYVLMLGVHGDKKQDLVTHMDTVLQTHANELFSESQEVIQDWLDFSTGDVGDFVADHSTDQYLTNAVRYYKRLKEKGLAKVEPGHDLRLGQPRHDLPKEEAAVPEATFINRVLDGPGAVASYFISLKGGCMDAAMEPTADDTGQVA